MSAGELRPEPDLAAGEDPAGASLTGPVVGSAIVAVLSGLLFGFDTAVISGTTDALVPL